MSLKIITSKKYRSQFKKQNENNQKLIDETVFKLANNEKLEPRFKEHFLKGKYSKIQECHIKPDLLLMYQKNQKTLTLFLLQVGSHSELF